MKSKGHTPPPAQIDHAAQLRDRLGKAAYEAAFDHEPVPWVETDESRRERYRTIGEAVMDAIVDRAGDRRGAAAQSAAEIPREAARHGGQQRMNHDAESADTLLTENARLRTQFAACLLANNEVALLNADYMIALRRIADTRGDCVGAELRAIAKDALKGIAPDPPF